jgi:hypothetical protein
MRRRNVFAALVVVALVVLVPVSAQGANGHANYHAVCPGPPAGYAHCHALVVTDAHGKPRAQSAPYGLSPSTIKSVYGFSTSSTAGSGQTIAIVDAYDDPTAESDLAEFSSMYGLPACTTANGCFKKVNQTGGSSYPRTDSGWALEISLDVQWAHAIAPGAKILLVEARSASLSNLLTAESYATAHADYVSNSWGASEFSSESLYDSYFSGASVFVSSGDNGLPAEWPSAASNVISVGGTTLHFSGSTFTGETGWSDGGGGCSAYETANSAQSGFAGYGQAHCGGKRATPDVSLDADPASGVSVYDSTPYSGQSGWWKVGGTSASSPMWAARSADRGAVVNSGYVYGDKITFRDITSGNNGALCLSGFDLCTGRGSWTGSDSGQTATVPVAPTLDSANAGDGSVQLTWTPPSSDGGSSITGYDVYRGTSPGGEGTVPVGTAGAGATSYDDNAASNGVTYYYTVAAVNSVGPSLPSNELSATPQSVASPGAPQNLTADSAKGRGVQLSWGPPTTGVVNAYYVYRSDVGFIASTTSTSYKDTQTARGTSYTYYVTADNSAGEGPASNTATATAK